MCFPVSLVYFPIHHLSFVLHGVQHKDSKLAPEAQLQDSCNHPKPISCFFTENKISFLKDSPGCQILSPMARHLKEVPPPGSKITILPYLEWSHA